MCKPVPIIRSPRTRTLVSLCTACSTAPGRTLINLARTGATRVFIFDHTIRRKKDSEPEDASTRGPVRSVHIDQSYRASVERVRYHLPDEAETLLQKRFQIINVRLTYQIKPAGRCLLSAWYMADRLTDR